MRRGRIATAVLWLVGAGIGWASLWSYAGAPGEAASAPARWPAASRLAAPQGHPKLVLFAHPLCPCTSASLDNLERLMPLLYGRLDVEVVVASMGSGSDAVLARVAGWPGVEPFLDEAAAETRRFGVETSGQVLVYDDSGALRFAGGITPARGHAGGSPGVEAVRSLALGDPPPVTTTVFGCAVRDRRTS